MEFRLCKDNTLGAKYEEIANKISESLAFMKACGITSENTPQLNQTTLFTSHETLFTKIMKRHLQEEIQSQKDWFNCWLICFGLEIELEI